MWESSVRPSVHECTLESTKTNFGTKLAVNKQSDSATHSDQFSLNKIPFDKMFIPIAKILKGKRIEKFCLLFIYISIFSCLAVYNKDHFTKYETVFEENVRFLVFFSLHYISNFILIVPLIPYVKNKLWFLIFSPHL